MYINFWYPIIRSEDLGYDQPEQVKVLGADLVVFRDQEGKARVLSDTCVHRGGSLGGKWAAGAAPRIVNGCVVCPYHGWEFGGDGKCKNIPSIGYGTKPPPRAKVEFDADASMAGWNAPEIAPWLEDSMQKASDAFFGKPSMYMGTGGTIPFMGMLGERFPEAQFLITGLLGPKSNAHGPNEFLHIETGKRLTSCVAQVIEEHFNRNGGGE